MAGDKSILPRFADGKVYLMKGKTMNAIIDLIARGRARPGRNVSIDVGPFGTIIHSKGGGTSLCPFGEFYQKAVDEELHWFVNGGTVTGGSGLLVLGETDLGAVEPPLPEPTYAWLHVSIEGIVEDGLLFSGGNLLTAEVGTGTSLPTIVLPTAAEPAGEYYIILGLFGSGRWASYGCGNFQIFHCPGAISHRRE